MSLFVVYASLFVVLGSIFAPVGDHRDVILDSGGGPGAERGAELAEGPFFAFSCFFGLQPRVENTYMVLTIPLWHVWKLFFSVFAQCDFYRETVARNTNSLRGRCRFSRFGNDFGLPEGSLWSSVWPPFRYIFRVVFEVGFLIAFGVLLEPLWSSFWPSFGAWKRLEAGKGACDLCL